jgi:hypothetical protein
VHVEADVAAYQRSIAAGRRPEGVMALDLLGFKNACHLS